MSETVTAHRGNSGELPENTLPAFESGIEVGGEPWVGFNDGNLTLLAKVKRLLALGVNRIYTDYPTRLLRIVQQTRHASRKDGDHE